MTRGNRVISGFRGKFLFAGQGVISIDGSLDSKGVLIYHRPHPGGRGGLDEKT